MLNCPFCLDLSLVSTHLLCNIGLVLKYCRLKHRQPENILQMKHLHFYNVNKVTYYSLQPKQIQLLLWQRQNRCTLFHRNAQVY